GPLQPWPTLGQAKQMRQNHATVFSGLSSIALAKAGEHQRGLSETVDSLYCPVGFPPGRIRIGGKRKSGARNNLHAVFTRLQRCSTAGRLTKYDSNADVRAKLR
ncbi:MAG: hypothetical protein KKF10_04700, partial [Verrucomicrobia bacterium]|nr:hypothetical protein [Verrucomicrobiota bacterium]